MQQSKGLLRFFRFIVLVLLGFSAGNTLAGELLPFRSDGCSMFPDGSRAKETLWLSCCRDHDLSYWRGGTLSQRRAADDALQQCVASKDSPQLAKLMWMGVSVGGAPWLPTPFRWGYGWPYPRGYPALSAEEEEQVARMLFIQGQ